MEEKTPSVLMNYCYACRTDNRQISEAFQYGCLSSVCVWVWVCVWLMIFRQHIKWKEYLSMYFPLRLALVWN